MSQKPILLIFCILLGYLFIPSVSAANEAEEKIEIARNKFFNCQIENVQQIDDSKSDAKAIALALTNQCDKEYAAQNKIFAQYNLDNSNERRMFTVDQNAKMLKIEASIHIVKLYRGGKLPIKKP